MYFVYSSNKEYLGVLFLVMWSLCPWTELPTWISAPCLPSPPLYSHFLLVLLAAGQLSFLVQQVEEGHQQQQQQNTHHHGYHHPAGSALLHLSYSSTLEGNMGEGVEGWGWGDRTSKGLKRRWRKGMILEEQRERGITRDVGGVDWWRVGCRWRMGGEGKEQGGEQDVDLVFTFWMQWVKCNGTQKQGLKADR